MAELALKLGGVKMKGFIYRLGQSLKDRGECAGHKRRWYAGAMIRVGLAIRDFAASTIRIRAAW